MPNEQKTLRSVVATWRAALVLVCFSGSTGDENTILLCSEGIERGTMRQHH
jgi:hypothetical protein